MPKYSLETPADVRLEALLSDEFMAEAGIISSPEGMRRFLLRSKTVAALREAITFGVITENAIRNFVDRLETILKRASSFHTSLHLGRWPSHSRSAERTLQTGFCSTLRG